MIIMMNAACVYSALCPKKRKPYAMQYKHKYMLDLSHAIVYYLIIDYNGVIKQYNHLHIFHYFGSCFPLAFILRFYEYFVEMQPLRWSYSYI